MRRWALICAALGCEAAPVTIEAPPAVVAAVTPVVSGDAVPVDPLALRDWLQGFAYRIWTPQTEIRATGEHGGERLYFNALLTRSMKAGAQDHPIGSAAVRELYSGDLKTLKGFALMHKIGPSGPTGAGWYWYEIFGTTAETEPMVAQTEARSCVGCHAHAVDFVHSPDTPREDPQPLL